MTGGTPAASNAGKEMSVPPPATAFTPPAKIPAPSISVADEKLIALIAPSDRHGGKSLEERPLLSIASSVVSSDGVPMVTVMRWPSECQRYLDRTAPESSTTSLHVFWRSMPNTVVPFRSAPRLRGRTHPRWAKRSACLRRADNSGPEISTSLPAARALQPSRTERRQPKPRTSRPARRPAEQRGA
jgi:hypothetical protein